MRNYDEYYKLALAYENEWFSKQKEEWWRKDEEGEEYGDHLYLMGEYLETVRLKSKHERNNSSLITNHTNVNNREWSILFHMLGQALIDWLIENNKTSIYSFSFCIHRMVDGLDNIYTLEKKVKVLEDEYKLREVKNPDPKFNECAGVLCDIVERFIFENRKDIPCDWNHFGFGLDDLMHSCEYGEWCSCSDGSISFGNEHEGEKYDTYDEYVSCM